MSQNVHIVVTCMLRLLWLDENAMMKKILIVEDEHDLIKLLKYNLEKEGYKVSYTTDGSLALAEIRRETPDLVVLDLMLPGMDGLEVCRQLRRHEKFASIPVLMLTARSEEADRVGDAEEGCGIVGARPVELEPERSPVGPLRVGAYRQRRSKGHKNRILARRIVCEVLAGLSSVTK